MTKIRHSLQPHHFGHPSDAVSYEHGVAEIVSISDEFLRLLKKQKNDVRGEMERKVFGK